ncbi:MAG: M20/M25/M40 family metallo-hydrolase [Oscillatoria sp. PMC 1068.18]|nr:M20/M25/M40 family metallo-hydrolase [Oscillatoria sp. PMC 1076.18]MEC4991509.1 M20/M25/M40 family metallo-hydrolase [Oscillatoria sp. PMC 1068.18]
MNLKQRLQNHLQEIVRLRDPYLNSGGHFFVQQYIRTQFEQWGTVEIHKFEMRSQTHQNLILNLPGKKVTKKPLLPILIGAHYDAVPGTPGADDNATGVAVLLELARIFANEPPKSPVRLIAFDLEEYGLIGSDRYVSELQQQKEKLRLMLSLEMLGYCDTSPNSQVYPPGLKYFYPNRGDFIALVGNLTTIPDLINLSRNFRKSGTPCQLLPVFNRGKMFRQTRLSDHAPFWDRNYPAIMATDTSFLRNPHYHQSTDTIASLDLDFLTGVCQGLATGIGKL